MSSCPRRARPAVLFLLLPVVLLALSWPQPARGAEGPDQESDTDWPTAISQLRQQLDRMPGHAATRQSLAIAYDNYGMSLLNDGRVSDAKLQLEEALRIDPDNQQFLTNLEGVHLRTAQQAYEAQHLDDARKALNQAIEIAPEDAQPYVLLGEIEYNAQRLKEAKAAWERALELNPNLPMVSQRLGQVDQELPVESKFERLSQVYFDIRFTQELERPSGYDMRDALLAARRQVGTDLSCWPRGKIVVLVYSADQFRALRRDQPDWVAGQFDGKIRVPLPGGSLDQEAVTRTLIHEYTHAVVHELTGNRCPVWLNEGLAEFEAWKQSQAPWVLLRRAAAANELISWEDQPSRFSTSLTQEDVGLAYEESHSIVRYLIERYGLWRVRQILKAVNDGGSINDILTAQLHAKLPRLEDNWREWLRTTLGGA